MVIIFSIILNFLSLQAQDADTVWSEVAPVCLNHSEVMKLVKYPEEARLDDIEGRVLIKLLVDQNGDVEKTGEISGPTVFYNEVKRVAINFKFSPGKINDYPIKCWVTVPFNFKIKKSN